MYKWSIALLFSAGLLASPVADFNKIGEGKMRYLFWTLYHAELFTDPANAAGTAADARALRITYSRKISRDALIEATDDQWQHLGYGKDTTAPWLTELNKIWPSVTPGDQLTIVILPNGHSQFYLGEKPIGAIADIAFGSAFLAIWLSENTSEPKLRRQLLGLSR